MSYPGKRNAGFTLLELMMVLAIVAILATVAYPSYLDSVRKARRADGMSAIMNVRLEQQKLRSNCRFYAENFSNVASACGASAAASSILGSNVSDEGHYAIALSNVNAVGYTITATGQGDQANDDENGVPCTLVLTVSGANPEGVRTPADCWD